MPARVTEPGIATSMSTTDDTATLHRADYHLADYGTFVRRRWWIVLVGLLVGFVVGLAAMQIVPPTYTSSANVLVSPVDLPGQSGNVAGGRTNDAINLDTESQLVTSAAVAEGAKKLMKSDESAQTLADRVSVSVPPNSSVLTIAYDGGTPEEAARGAHYFAESYLANRKATAESSGEALASTLKKQVKDLEKQLKKVTGRIAELPLNSTDRQLASAEQNVLTSQLSSLNAQLAPLEDLEVNPGRIITDAAPPSSPSQPVPVLFLVSGAMLGLLGGLVFAALRDRGDHSIRRARDVTRLLDLPVLADVEIPARTSTWSHLLPSQSGAAQEVRQLQHAVTGVRGRHPKVLLVTAASAGPGAHVVAANLTATLARSGKRVVHVCADLTTARGAEMLGVPTGRGLSEILLGERDVSYALQQAPANEHISVLTPGHRSDELGDTLHTDALRAIATTLRDRFDYVVLETPATTISADAQAWAQFSDVAVVAVQRLLTRREDAIDAVNQLERVGCATLGIVVLPRHPKGLGWHSPLRPPMGAEPQRSVRPASRPGATETYEAPAAVPPDEAADDAATAPVPEVTLPPAPAPAHAPAPDSAFPHTEHATVGPRDTKREV